MTIERSHQCKVSWVKPFANSLKFSVDGAVEGGFGRAGVGGILRNSNNKTLILFSKSVGCCDATSAELFALKEAVQVFRNSIWTRSFTLILETDCLACVEWFYKPHLAPTVFKDIISECLRECTFLRWEIIVILRAANATADKLAKSGIARARPLFWEAMT
ncbi:hypothetical protein V6N11_026432 [Hibiscus sabdariffa]|uniref:RNase H type-1 domain-containing protein n=2 Tax=Hibiscus sabdariffa TaxID=183260 RepID=A0ABR2SVQ9_9ROSI